MATDSSPTTEISQPELNYHAHPEDVEHGSLADSRSPRYTVNELRSLATIGGASAFLASFGLAPFIRVPSWNDARFADAELIRRYFLSLSFKYVGLASYTILLTWFMWRHHKDRLIWICFGLGGLVLGIIIGLAIGMGPPVAIQLIWPWSILFSMVGVAVYRRRNRLE